MQNISQLTHEDVLIFSPHCDDVPLSMGGAILAGVFGRSVRVEVVFSTSQYSLIDSVKGDVAEVTRIRHSEELAAAQMAGYEVRFAGFPEPFVRPGYRTLRDLFDTRRSVHEDLIWPSVRETLASRLAAAKGLTLWPLRCGQHIDHRIVYQVLVEECQRAPHRCFGLYEDLPYAAGFVDREIESLIPELPTGPLRPVIISAVPCSSKMTLLENYASQLARADIEMVHSHWNRTGGERLWLSPEAIEAIISRLQSGTVCRRVTSNGSPSVQGSSCS